ncbi:hypothetical protein ACJROX_19560 [Pseudalkalibacillus sp. A8]|uniref:hypothetical protein n=1 Tax=Pseudalkalibacillus sp. A8 TaxID=3382641 RepID=UPI0038B63DCB
MRKIFIINLLFVLFVSLAFITPYQQFDQQTLTPSEEKVLSSFGYLAPSESAALSTTILIPKVHSKTLFNDHYLFAELSESVAFDLVSGSPHFLNAAIFIYAVMYQSNYLS